MNPEQPTASPRAIGNVASAVVEAQAVWPDPIEYPSDPGRDKVLAAATWILVGFSLSASLWGLTTLLLYCL